MDLSLPASCGQVLKRRYGKEADIWSCGVILYILLSGVPPFWGETEQQIFDAVAKGHIDFKTDPWPNVSSEAKDAVRVMLQQASLSALCNGKGGRNMLSASRMGGISSGCKQLQLRSMLMCAMS